jgi:hypothetical protein
VRVSAVPPEEPGFRQAALVLSEEGLVPGLEDQELEGRGSEYPHALDALMYAVRASR